MSIIVTGNPTIGQAVSSRIIGKYEVPMSDQPSYVLRGNRPFLCLPAPYKEQMGGFCNQHYHLKEANYKQIASKIDPNFLLQEIRAKALEAIKYSSIAKKSMLFAVRSSEFTANTTTYKNVFRFRDWDDIVDDDTMTPIFRARLLMFAGDLELHCTCPSFLFWGYQYLLTQMDAAMVPEQRPPDVRNPGRRGIVCKHLNRSLRAFPWHAMKLAAHIRQNHRIAEGKTAIEDEGTKLLERVLEDPDLKVTYGDILNDGS